MNQFDLMAENQMLKIENEQLKEELEELREGAYGMESEKIPADSS